MTVGGAPPDARDSHRRSQRVRALVAVALAVGATAAAGGCGGGSGGSRSGTESPADFVRRVTTEFSRGQSGRLWDELLPTDQRIVSRARFVECQSNVGWNLKSLKVLETYDDPVHVSSRTLSSKAVTVRVASDDGVTTATMHAVPVNGKWRWILEASDRRAYERGTCPTTG